MDMAPILTFEYMLAFFGNKEKTPLRKKRHSIFLKMSYATLVHPNRIAYDGETKIVAGFGRSADGFWMKTDLLGFAKQFDVKDADKLTRAQLASALLCRIAGPETDFRDNRSNVKNESKLFTAWFDKKVAKNPYPTEYWTPLQKNGRHKEWFHANVENQADFGMYMYGVLIGLLPSPLCDFKNGVDSHRTHVHKKTHAHKAKQQHDNPANSWWGGDAHALLVKMNEPTDNGISFTSLDSRTITAKGNEHECKSEPSEALETSVFSNRAYLVGIMTKEAAPNFVRNMNQRGFVCWCTGMQKPGEKDLHYVTKSVTDFNIEMKSCDKLMRLSPHSPLLLEKLRNTHYYVNMFDPHNHRPAEDENGLFTVALCVLQDSCPSEDKE